MDRLLNFIQGAPFAKNWSACNKPRTHSWSGASSERIYEARTEPECAFGNESHSRNSSTILLTW
jgi:hypothetical protein